MPEIDEEARQYINSQFVEWLEATDPPRLDVLVEVEPGQAGVVSERIRGITGVQLDSDGAIAGMFIPANIPEEQINRLARVDGVEKVHYDQPMTIGMAAFGPDLVAEDAGFLPFIDPAGDPVRNAVSDEMFKAAMPDDAYLGGVRISEVVAPRFNFGLLPPGDPAQTLVTAFDQATGASTTGHNFIPTGETVDWMLNGGVTDGHDGEDAQVAVIDTGHTPIEPANGFRSPRLESMVPGEPPWDGHGHGSWCTYTAVGGDAPSTWGRCSGVAPGSPYAHYKALNTFPGFGKSSWILRAMERANKWGADVISMSLGGTQQGPITEGPYSKFVRRFCKENMGTEEGSIFVVAAGNSGPDKWTIGSPGVAEKAITVASWSMMDDAPAVWSSRGPQGAYYKNHQEEFTKHLEKFGSTEFIKPDLAAPGGGRKTSALADDEDEYLHQTETGWMEGLFDGLRDTRGAMHGTSQATPHAAGLIARLFDAGIIKNASEVKRVVRKEQDVGKFEDAAANANGDVSGKNTSVGFGAFREDLFTV